VFGLDKEADLIWHEHITWTAKYRADMEAIFGAGQFLNHTPNTPPDWQKRLSDALALYQKNCHQIPPDANTCCTQLGRIRGSEDRERDAFDPPADLGLLAGGRSSTAPEDEQRSHAPVSRGDLSEGSM
jgi:hypothetical protein